MDIGLAVYTAAFFVQCTWAVGSSWILLAMTVRTARCRDHVSLPPIFQRNIHPVRLRDGVLRAALPEKKREL